MAAMQKQMADLKVREAMSSMMKNIKPEQMTEMAKSMGMDISEEQAKQVSSMMENMDEKTMERLMQLSRATGAVAKFQQAKAFLATPTGRKLFMALNVAGLALLVRWPTAGSIRSRCFPRRMLSRSSVSMSGRPTRPSTSRAWSKVARCARSGLFK